MGKIVFLKNYNESECKQNKLHLDVMSRMMFWKLPKNNNT